MVLEGLTAVLQPLTIALVALGTIVGIIFGSIPGLTATMAVVMFLPVTYSVTSSQGISMLMALYIGGISGGLISAIAQGKVAAASLNILAKKPDDWSKGMVLCITVEFYAILSLLASMLMIINISG